MTDFPDKVTCFYSPGRTATLGVVEELLNKDLLHQEYMRIDRQGSLTVEMLEGMRLKKYEHVDCSHISERTDTRVRIEGHAIVRGYNQAIDAIIKKL